jgi:subtilisin-like proprotein convertase family protein
MNPSNLLEDSMRSRLTNAPLRSLGVSRRLCRHSFADGVCQRKLSLEHLEDRRLLIVGANFAPDVIDPGEGYDGVVLVGSQFGAGSGVVLSDGRHILTAAHVIDPNHTGVVSPTGFYSVGLLRRDAAGETVAFNFAVDPEDITLSPDWVATAGSTGIRAGDLAIIEWNDFGQAALFPGGRAVGFDIYRGSDEVGKAYEVMGFGTWGSSGLTGATQAAGDVRRSGVNTFDVLGSRLNNEVKSVHVNATAGFFSLGFQGQSTGPTIPHNATTSQVAAALNSLSTIQAGGGSVNVHGAPGDWYVEFVGGWAGSDVAPMSFSSGSLNGTISVLGEKDGGAIQSGEKMLVSDFDSGAVARDTLGQFFGSSHFGLGSSAEAISAHGDSGGPLFIDGKVAGISANSLTSFSTTVSGEPSVFGALSIDTRVSAYQSWIDSEINSDRLNLRIDLADHLASSRRDILLRVAGPQLEIVIDNQLFYRALVSQFDGLTILGDGDDNYRVDSSLSAALDFPLTFANSSLPLNKGDDSLIIDATSNAAGAIVTLGASSVGAGVGDTLFTSGGRVNYQEIRHLELNLGVGADQVTASNLSATLRVVGGGGDDVLIMAALPDTLAFDGGSGTDAFRYSGSQAITDLASLPDSALQNLETLDLRGAGHNHLLLSASDAARFSASTQSILVKADADDQVNLTPGVSFTGSQIIDGADYLRFAEAGASVLVSDQAVLRLDPPLAISDAYAVNEEGALAVDAAAAIVTNDASGVLSVSLVSAPRHAANFSLNPNGTFNYTPTANFSGDDEFTYISSYGSYLSNVATVKIDVLPLNDAPVAIAESYTVTSGGTLVANTSRYAFPAVDVPLPLLSHDTAISRFQLTSDLLGTITDVQIQLTIENFNDIDIWIVGPDRTRVALASHLRGNNASLSNVLMTDHADSPLTDASTPISGSFRPTSPLAAFAGKVANGIWQLEVVDHAASGIGLLVSWSLLVHTKGATGGNEVIGVLGNDGDADDDMLTAELVQGPEHAASFQFNADGSFTYLHDGVSAAADSFTYRTHDPRDGVSAPVTVSVAVTAFVPVGAPIQLNQVPGDNSISQLYQPSVGIDDSGRFVAAYTVPEDITHPSPTSVQYKPVPYGRLFDDVGQPRGGAFTIAPTDQSAEDVDVVALPDGRFIVAYERFGIFVQRFDASGNKIGGPLQANGQSLGNGGGHPKIAADEVGNFVVTWERDVPNDQENDEVYARRFNHSTGNWESEILVGIGRVGQTGHGVDVAMNANGFVVVWTQRNPNSTNGTFGIDIDIQMRRYSNAGTALSGPLRVNTTTPEWQKDPQVAMDAAGRFTVVWEEPGVVFRSFDANGNPLSDQVQLNFAPEFAGNPKIARNQGGEYVIVWTSSINSISAVKAQVFFADGSPIGETINVSAAFNSFNEYQEDAQVAINSDGDFVVAWQRRLMGLNPPTPPRIYAQLFASVRTSEPRFPGDYVDDEVVNGADFLLWQRGFGAVVRPGDGSDGNRNAAIDGGDLSLWHRYFGQEFDRDADDFANATLIVPPLTLHHGFSDASDVDWFGFTATPNNQYSFELAPEGLGVATLQLVASDGVTVLAEDTGGFAAQIDWISPNAGTYYLRATIVGGLAQPYTLIADISGYAVGGLTGYWNFDGDGMDSSQGNRPLSLDGGVGFAAGLAGQALDLHGSTAQYAYRPVSDAEFNFGVNDFSIQIWVNFNSTAGEQTLIEKFTGSEGPGWTLTKLNDNSILFYSTSEVVRTPPLTIDPGVWHQFVVQREGSAFRLLYDNQIVASAIDSTALPPSPHVLLIGKRNPADGRGFAVDGRVDEVGIWNRAIEFSEIATLYNGGAGRPILPTDGLGQIGVAARAGDVRSDGNVDGDDLSAWASQFDNLPGVDAAEAAAILEMNAERRGYRTENRNSFALDAKTTDAVFASGDFAGGMMATESFVRVKRRGWRR